MLPVEQYDGGPSEVVFDGGSPLAKDAGGDGGPSELVFDGGSSAAKDAGRDGGTSEVVLDGGMGETLSETRILELRQCVIARQSVTSPQGGLIVSGSDLVQGYRQCRNGTDGEEIAAFRTVMDGFAQPLEGKWPQFKLAVSL